MRNIAITSLCVLALSSIASADDTKPEPPKCTIVKIDGKDTAIEVDRVFANGARWAEYNCRQYSRKPATDWISQNGGCGAHHVAFKYTLALGPKGKEKMIDMTIMCPK